MAKKKYTFIDLFAGCGGLSEGFMETNRFESLAHVEWEMPMVETLRNRLVKRWGFSEDRALENVIHFDIQKTEELLHGNLSDESRSKYGKTNSTEFLKGGLCNVTKGRTVDVVIGGPPCQAYSIHGRAQDPNSMNDDYRNYLFESFLKVVDYFKPRLFLFENVPGILTAHPGGKKITERIYSAFREIGYLILEPSLLKQAMFNACDFRVPQNRDRVLIIGLPIGTNLSHDEIYHNISAQKDEHKVTVRDAIGFLTKIFPLDIPIVKGRGRISHAHSEACPYTQHEPRYNGKREIGVFADWILNDMNHATKAEQVAYYKRVTGKDTLYIKYRNLEWDKQSPTVVAHLQKDGYMFIHPDPQQARSITVREAALLMTFPIDFEFIGSMAYCFKMIGNAVPVNFAKAIALAIYKSLEEKEHR